MSEVQGNMMEKVFHTSSKPRHTIMGKGTKIVISQPMKDLSKEQIYANRQSAIGFILSQGHSVVDTVFDFESVPDIRNKSLYYLAKSLEFIAEHADAVYFLKGWENARGCKLEHQCCEDYDVPIIYEDASYYKGSTD